MSEPQPDTVRTAILAAADAIARSTVCRRCVGSVFESKGAGMTINKAITAVLSASHHGDQYFRKFLLGDDPEVVRMRDALMQLEDAVREDEESIAVQLRDLQSRHEYSIRYIIALQRSIEHHCLGQPVPDRVSEGCPLHAKALNERLRKVLEMLGESVDTSR